MSRLIFELVAEYGVHRRSLVKTNGGMYYCVDTNDTYDVGMETMVFLGREGCIFVESWDDIYSRRYKDLQSAVEGHNEIVKNLEMYINERQKDCKVEN